MASGLRMLLSPRIGQSRRWRGIGRPSTNWALKRL
jgi:hypothetical protein